MRRHLDLTPSIFHRARILKTFTPNANKSSCRLPFTDFTGMESQLYHHRIAHSVHPFPHRIQQLRNNNNPPLDYDKPLLLETVRTGPRRLTLRQVPKQERRQLVENVAIAQAALRPVRRLNDTVLSEIFIACWEDMNRQIVNGNCNSLNSDEPPWTVSQVCRRWRSVALNTAKIWSSIKLTFYEDPMTLNEEKNFYYMLGLQLERSQKHDLFLLFRGYEDFSHYVGLQVLLSVIPRCTQLAVIAPSDLFHFFSACRGSFGALKDLFLFDITDPEDQEDESPDFEIDAFEWAPNLRDLHLVALGPAPWIEHMKIPWSQLNSYASHLAFDHVDRVGIRKACSAKTIFLHCPHPNGQTPMEVDLPHVRNRSYALQHWKPWACDTLMSSLSSLLTSTWTCDRLK